jgi:hypothetical protein
MLNKQNTGNMTIIARLHKPLLVAFLFSMFSGLAADGADVLWTLVYKRRTYAQVNTGAPSLSGSAPHRGGAGLFTPASNSVNLASCALPSGGSRDLTDSYYEDDFLPPHWERFEASNYGSKAALDASWPNGNYTLLMATAHDGFRSTSHTLTGDSYPNPPRIQNFSEAQSVDASRDFILKWDSFVGGTTNDVIYLLIQDWYTDTVAFCTALPYDSRCLNGKALQVRIPAGSFRPGQSYDGQLWFGKVTSRKTSGYPGVLALGGYASRTFFELVTGSAVLPVGISAPPQSLSVTQGAAATFSVGVTGSAPFGYQWQKNGASIPSANAPSFTIASVQGVDAGGYSVVVSNAAGAVTSAVAVLTVIVAAMPPAITAHPQSQTVVAGSYAPFIVRALGTAPMYYQWRFNGADIAGATDDVLDFPATLANAGLYSVVVTNAAGAVTSAVAVLTVLANPPTATNRVLTLDGQGDFVWIPSAPDLQNPTAITIEAWLYPVINPSQFNPHFIAKSDGQIAWSSRSYELNYVTNSWNTGGGMKIEFSIFLGASNWVVLGAPFRDRQWVHVAATYESRAGILSLYTNGILAAYTTTNVLGPLAGQTLRQTPWPLYLGTLYDYQSFAMGSMDEVRIWDKARTPDEIYRDRYCRLTGSEPNLVAYWTFDDATAMDGTGRGHNGNFGGNAQALSIVGYDAVHTGACGSGMVNPVLWLAAVGDYVTTPDPASLALTPNWTLEAWVNPSLTLPDGNPQGVIAKNRFVGGTGYRLGLSGNKPELGVVVGAGGQATMAGIMSTEPVSSGTWHHLCGTYDGSFLKLYVDGLLKASASATLEMQPSSLPIYLGQEGLPGDRRSFLGLMDEVRIWNKARDAGEIYRDRSCRLTGTEANLVAYWNFDGGWARDLTGHGLSGALMGHAQIIEMTGEDVIHGGCNRVWFTGMLLNSARDLTCSVASSRTGVVYRIDTSTNMVNWSQFLLRTNTRGTFEFKDVIPAKGGGRFYRVVE